jgi:hypothetical protein
MECDAAPRCRHHEGQRDYLKTEKPINIGEIQDDAMRTAYMEGFREARKKKKGIG